MIKLYDLIIIAQLKYSLITFFIFSLKIIKNYIKDCQI